MGICTRHNRKKLLRCWTINVNTEEKEAKWKTKKVSTEKYLMQINYSKKLKISSILPDRDSDYVILLELEDGSKFEIIIMPTRRFV